MSNQNDDQHDMTRKMLNTIRENQVPKNLKFLNEFQNAPSIGGGFETADSAEEAPNAVASPNSDDSIQPSSEELAQEQQRFRETVGPRVEFTTFNIYPQAGNVVFGGKFQDMDGLEWQFSLEETDGIYITANNMQVSDDVVTRIQKLRGYYDNWAGDWSQKLATEYKGNIK